MDQDDDIHLWESNLPKYIFPQTFQFLEIIRLCQVNDLPNERALVTHNKEILFTIAAESINQMLQIKPRSDEAPLSVEILTELYLKLDFPKRFQIFQTFQPSSVETQKSNPPYLASIFLERTRLIVTMMSCILGYFTDEYVDASILGFLSIFYPRQPPSFIFNFAQYLSVK